MSAPTTREDVLGSLAKAVQTPALADAVKDLGNEILTGYDTTHTEFRFTRGPVTGVIAAQVIEPISGQRFLPGDVVASEAGVNVDGHDGWGMCFGTDRAAALALAVCDAEIARGTDWAAKVRELAARCARELADQRAREFERLRPSIVEFEEIS